MPTSIETAKIVAGAALIPEKTMLVAIRRHGEAGTISRGGRGKNAPAMSKVDVARMVIGLLAAETIEDMPLGAKVFGCIRSAAKGGVWSGEPTDDTIKLPAYEHSFEIAIAEILEQLAALPIGAEPPKIRILLHVNDLLGQIYLGGRRYEYLHATLRDVANKLTDDTAPFLSLRSQYQSKIETVRTIHEDALYGIAASLREEEARDVKQCA
jgi:hypothetical protein